MYGEIFQRVGSNVANVGNFNADNGLNVNNWDASNRNDNLFAAPLVASFRRNLGGFLLGRSYPSSKHSTYFLKNFGKTQVVFIIYCLRVFCQTHKNLY